MFGMSDKDTIDRVWDIIEQVSVCMLTTQFVGGRAAARSKARPLCWAYLFRDRYSHQGR
jgi:hypothetical protein